MKGPVKEREACCVCSPGFSVRRGWEEIGCAGAGEALHGGSSRRRTGTCRLHVSYVYTQLQGGLAVTGRGDVEVAVSERDSWKSSL